MVRTRITLCSAERPPPLPGAQHACLQKTHSFRVLGACCRTPISARTGPVPSPWQPAHGLGYGSFSTWCRRSPGGLQTAVSRDANPRERCHSGHSFGVELGSAPRSEILSPPPAPIHRAPGFTRLQKLARTAQICQVAQRANCLRARSTTAPPEERAQSWSLAGFREPSTPAIHGHRVHEIVGVGPAAHASCAWRQETRPACPCFPGKTGNRAFQEGPNHLSPTYRSLHPEFRDLIMSSFCRPHFQSYRLPEVPAQADRNPTVS